MHFYKTDLLTSFNDLGLSQEVLKVLSELGFEKPSEIQEKSIPTLLTAERDFIGLAQTGTGKTAAFGLPLMERIDAKDRATQALVLAPTRELGQQIAQQLTTFSKYKNKLNVMAVYGGANISTQIKALKNPQQIIIATPGRLIDLIGRKAVKLNQVKFVVLDEADEMLNMGFKEDIDRILEFTPDTKNTWLFSATMPNEIKKIVDLYMDDPFEVRINTKEKVNVNIDHQYVPVKHSNKPEALCRFLDMIPEMRGVVFCRTKRETQNVAEFLLKNKYRADALHGDLSQNQRDRVMKRFKEHDLQVLIATDVAARGIDVNDLTHVFHFNLPDDLAYYTHRSGRTARAGKEGISLVFAAGKEKEKLKRLEKSLKITFDKVEVPDGDSIAAIRLQKWAQNILSTKVKGKVDPQFLELADALFGGISKEELLAKLVASELEKLSVDKSKDLNDNSRSRGGGNDGRRRGGGGSGQRDGKSRRNKKRPPQSKRRGEEGKRNYGGKKRSDGKKRRFRPKK